MKKTIFVTATVLVSCFGLTGLALAGSQDGKAAKSSAVESNTGSSNMGSSNMGSSNMGSSNMGSSNMGPSNMGSSNMGPSNMDSSNMGPSSMGSSNMGSGAMMKQQKDATSLSTSQVRELQTLLKEDGYKVGNIDGIIGPITTGAIRQYQTDRNLEVTGIPNDKTLRSLAPEREDQEFFGLAPEFGDKESMTPEKDGVKSGKDGMTPEKDSTTPEKDMDAEPTKKGY